MNERIKELEEKATVTRGRMRVVDTTKFADLIIEACINQCRQEWYDLNNDPKVETDPRSIGIRVGQKGGVIRTMSRIRKYFGMSE